MARFRESEHAHEITRPQHRNVGIVIETRPDHVNPAEVRRLRQLGVTKVQMGAQTFDERVLFELNKRGHTAEETRMAVAILRSAGFKIVLHWMPNLLGATLKRIEKMSTIFGDDGAHPDELNLSLFAEERGSLNIEARRVVSLQ